MGKRVEPAGFRCVQVMTLDAGVCVSVCRTLSSLHLTQLEPWPLDQSPVCVWTVGGLNPLLLRLGAGLPTERVTGYR